MKKKKRTRVLSPDDVIQSPKLTKVTERQTMTASDLIFWIMHETKLSSAYDGRCLLADSGGGWKSGRIHLSLTFESYELNDEAVDLAERVDERRRREAESDEILQVFEEGEKLMEEEPPSPLDDIRKQIREKGL